MSTTIAGGFCCKAGLVQFERMYRTNPKRFDYHESEMERALAKIGDTARPFLRQTMTWDEIPEKIKIKIIELQREQEDSGFNEDGDPVVDNRSRISTLKIRYITLREFRQQMEAGTMELPMFSESGCGCFTDEAA